MSGRLSVAAVQLGLRVSQAGMRFDLQRLYNPRTKKGTLVHLLLSYVQVAYRGGHISFVGGKRVVWVYDITALTQHQAQVAEQERQLREILDYSPAAVGVVDEEGRLLFHNWRLREMTGYENEELELFDADAGQVLAQWDSLVRLEPVP